MGGLTGSLVGTLAMNWKVRLVTLGIGCFAAGFLTCYLFLSQPCPTPGPAAIAPPATAAPVDLATVLTFLTGAVPATNLDEIRSGN